MNQYKEFMADVSITFLSSIANIILAFPITVLIGRYLGADDLGLYRLVLTIYSIAVLFFAVGVPAAIIKYISEYQNDRMKVCTLFSAGVSISLLLGIISLFCFLLSSEKLGLVFHMPELPHLINIIAISLPFSLIGSTLLASLNGFRRMNEYAIATVLQSILMLFTTFLFAYIGYGISGIMFGVVISSIVYCIYLFIVTKEYFIKVSIDETIIASKKLCAFGMHTVIANSINLINFQADTLMIGYFMTKADVGFYSIAVYLAKLLWIAPDSIQKITYPMISNYYGQKKEQSIKQVVSKTMEYTACGSLLIGIPMLIYGKEIIIFIYGNSFIQSISAYHILIIGTIIFSIIKSISSLFASIGQVNLFARIPAYSAITNIILNIILIPSYGTIGAAIATSTSLLIYVLVMVHYMKKFLGINLDLMWYVKSILIFINSFLLNKILLIFVPIYISGIIVEIVLLYVVWNFLLNTKERLLLTQVFLKPKFNSKS